MHDLNDLYYFVSVVDHGGFAAAGRALGLQKSKLSRRILQVEERLGVRLLNRSSRRFSVTEIVCLSLQSAVHAHGRLPPKLCGVAYLPRDGTGRQKRKAARRDVRAGRPLYAAEGEPGHQ
jgi:Bacterial regulatory helix-turn-helix protein, lysR family